MSRTNRTTAPRIRPAVLLTAIAAVSVGLGSSAAPVDTTAGRVDLVSLAAQAAGNKGAPVIAGKVTKSRKLTTVQRTRKGPALRLRTKASSPPLKVTSRKLVAKLNADQLDGRDADALETRTYTYRVTPSGAPDSFQRAEFPGLPDGTFLVSYAVTLDGEGAFGSAQCFLRQEGASDAIGLTYAALKGSFATASSTASFDTADGVIALVCSASVSMQFDDTDTSSEVTFTRTDLVEREAVTSNARPVPDSGGAAASKR